MKRKLSGIVTLITDFGWSGEYAGAMKGAILKVNPRCQVVDVTHQVEPQNILQASYVLKNSYPYYPLGTIHVVVVDPGVGTDRRAVVLEKEGHLFVGPDNGVFGGLLSAGGKTRGTQITRRKYLSPSLSDTFHGRDIFAPAAGHLSLGRDPRLFGAPAEGLAAVPWPGPRARPGGLEARVLWADSFGNLITNVRREEHARELDARSFRIKGRGWAIDRVHRTYGEGRPGQPLALFGSGGLLELSVNRGSALRNLGLKPGDSITIRWR